MFPLQPCEASLAALELWSETFDFCTIPSISPECHHWKCPPSCRALCPEKPHPTAAAAVSRCQSLH